MSFRIAYCPSSIQCGSKICIIFAPHCAVCGKFCDRYYLRSELLIWIFALVLCHMKRNQFSEKQMTTSSFSYTTDRHKPSVHDLLIFRQARRAFILIFGIAFKAAKQNQHNQQITSIEEIFYSTLPKTAQSMHTVLQKDSS